MCAGSPIRVVTVDDHPFLRSGIVAVIEEEDDMQVVAEASTGREAIELFRQHTPDVTLMDLQLPDLSGIDAIVRVRSDFPDARIIVLTTFEGDMLVRRALRAGAWGFILKSTLRKDLIEAIRSVHAGKKHIPAAIATRLAERIHDDDLTMRELEVLKAVSAGRTNRKIGAELAISEETVKAHMKNILMKLGASDRTHAVSVATIRGFLL